MDIEKIKTRLSESIDKSLINQRLLIVAALKNGGLGTEAALLKEAIDEELMCRFPGPDDGWSAGVQGDPRVLRRSGLKCAIVFRLETHGIGKGSYLIEVMGKTLPDQPRNVDNAKKLAEIAMREDGMG